MPRALLLTATAVAVAGLPAVGVHAATTTVSTTITSSATAAAPCKALDATKRTDPLLAGGLSLRTPHVANLVPAGQQPRVELVVTQPVTGTLTYTVTRRTQRLLTRTITIPATTTALPMPKVGPGAYQVEARALTLNGAGKLATGTCLRFGVNMPGARLDMTNLPSGSDWGGPAAERDVVLQKALGGSVVRRQVSFSSFQQNNSQYDETFRAAAARAKATGVAFVVQVGQGGAAERAAIGSSAWENDVRALVARNKGVVPNWEAWNEPNIDYFFPGANPATYVNKVLKPFYRAVKAADPSAKVVGGSTFGLDLGWWRGFAAAGGFQHLDVVSFHGYMWDTAWEGMGIVEDIERLRSLKNAHGGKGKPMWDTESGYRSLAEAGGAWAQADYATHKMLWERMLGIPTQTFLVEGGWEDWSVIDQVRGVKPAAMALSTLRTVLDGRKYLGRVATNTKGVYAAKFGPRTSGGSSIVAVWTAGPTRILPLKAKHTGMDMLGAPISVGTRTAASGSVRYLDVKPGQPVL